MSYTCHTLTIPPDGLDHHFPVALQLLRSRPKCTTILPDGLDHDSPVASCVLPFEKIASVMLIVWTLALDWTIPIDHWHVAFYDVH